MFCIISRGWTLSNIEAVIFDKDGTFIDLHYFWGKMTEMRVLEIIKRLNLDTEHFPTLCEYLGYDIKTSRMLSDGITALYSRVKIIELFQKKMESTGIKISTKELEEIFDSVSEEFYKEIEKHTKPIDSAIEFIKDLRQKGLKIAIVTSDSLESTQLTLKQFGWEDLFDVVMGRESTSETKESGIPTKLALEKLGVEASNALMIGDAPTDAISAKNAGIKKTILVATGQVGIEELEKYSCYVLDSLKGLTCLKI